MYKYRCMYNESSWIFNVKIAVHISAVHVLPVSSALVIHELTYICFLSAVHVFADIQLFLQHCPVSMLKLSYGCLFSAVSVFADVHYSCFLSAVHA